ncbi:MAG: hypothetical protein B6D38_00645 [Anaerolineae bacterium UTCFX1]|jgi:hypothetical protein|nr:MAG: hypothetical protein B6D38_00645 [Anaerolineae bacterium UTCFX1]
MQRAALAHIVWVPFFYFQYKGDRAYEEQQVCTINIVQEGHMKRFGLLFLILFSLGCSLLTPPPQAQQAISAQSFKQDLTTPTVDPKPTAHTIPETCTVSADALHLRSCAGLHCTVIAWLSQGDVLTVQETDHDWIKVTTPVHQTGWVHSKYCGGSK